MQISVIATLKNNHIIKCRVSKGSHINYCYIYVDLSTKDAVLIDPAWEENEIHKVICKYGANVAAVLVTHHHYDHLNLATAMSTYYDCPVVISEVEYQTYKLEFDHKRLLTSESTFLIAEISILPIFTPGHTAGSTCYLIDNSLFTGDTLFNEGAGACSGQGGDAKMMFASFERLKSELFDDTRIFPGHRFKSELGLTFEKIKDLNIYLQFDREDIFVEFLTRKTLRFHSFI